KGIARALNLPVSDARRQQLKVLKKLLRKARFTQFGQLYKFDEILMSHHPGKKFQQLVPTYNYNKIYEDWWYKTLEGIPDVCGPGLYKPGKKIAKERDWAKKLEEVVENAPNWDIGFIVGVPAWLQLCIEKIIERYNLKNIHEIWPNLAFYVHGGVALEPYKKG